ncbi:MAG: lipopolysaccharide biosynthesis protein [Smithellaceae bacterium]
MAYGKGDLQELSALLTGGVALSGLISLLVIITGFVSSTFLINVLNLRTTTDSVIVKQAFILAVVGSAFMIFSFGLTAFNQGLQSSFGIGLVFVVTMIAGLAITVILLYKGVGLLALPIGSIVRGVGLTLGNVAYLLWRSINDKMRYRVSFKGIFDLAKLSSFTFLGRGAGVIAANLDAFVLTRYLSPEIAAAFVLTRKAPDTSRMLLERPAVAFMPAVSSLVGAGDMERAKVVLLRLLRMILWLMGLIAGGFFLFNDAFVSLWVGPKLFAGQTINLIIVLALILSVLMNSLGNLCFSLGNIKGNSLATLLQGIIAIPLMILGARHWGMVGVALAPVIAMLAVSFWYYPMTFSRLLKINKKDFITTGCEFTFASLATITAVVTLSWFQVQSWETFIFAIVSFCIVYTICLIILSPLFRSEASVVLKILK